MEADAVDPLDWTVDQVVAFLCHNASTPWSQSANPSRRPDPIAFEAALRENLINGEVLLNDVDKDTLRGDLGLQALGHRSTILAAIRYLRQISLKYQRIHPVRNAGYDDLQRAFSPVYSPSAAFGYGVNSPLQRPSVTVPVTASPYQKSHRASAPLAPPTPALQSADVDVNNNTDWQHSHKLSSINMRQLTSEFPSRAQTVVDDCVNNSERVSEGPTSPAVPYSKEPRISPKSSPHLRSYEHYVVDMDGNKRRKLDLNCKPADAGPTVADKQRQIVLDVTEPREWYMGPNAITPDNIFYPVLQESETGVFTIVSPKLPTGHRLFVKSCLQHFHRQRPVELGPDRGRQGLAIFPYKRSVLENGQQEFFTFYSSHNSKVTVTKESTANWPLISHHNISNSFRAVQHRDPYDYLVHKYPAKDDDEDLYPVYGESGSEGEYDPDTWREIEDERRESTLETSRYLNPQEVDSFITRYIEECEEKWRSERRSKEESKARNMWLMAKKHRTRNVQIKAILRDIELLQERLKKIQKGIRQHDYTKDADLRSQCQSMEQTIYSIESQSWRASILEQEKCPPKISFIPKPRVTKPRGPVDEESLDSESEDLVNDSLDSFIDYDSETNHYVVPDLPFLKDHSSLQEDQYIISTDSDSDYPFSPLGRKGKQNSRNGRELHRNVGNTPEILSDSRSSHHLLPLVSVGGQEIECIDLTRSSPNSPIEDFEIETPPLNPVRLPNEDDDLNHLKMESPLSLISSRPDEVVPRSATKMITRTPPHQSPGKRSLPNISDFRGITSVPWETLEERQDRQRLLTKLIGSLPNDERDQMKKAIPTYTSLELRKFTRNALQNVLHYPNKTWDSGTAKDETLMRVVSLYISWVNCIRLNERGIRKTHVTKALNDMDGFDIFADQLSARLSNYYITFGTVSSGESGIPFGEESDHNLQAASAYTPHKKRKREIKENQEVKRNHESAQLRVALQEEQRKCLELRLETMGVGNDDPERQAISFGNPIIYLDSHIGRRVKPHQLNGIRFMWRELIQNERREGCLLAHTMGLGKTMQVYVMKAYLITTGMQTDLQSISLLVAISEAAASTDVSIQSQVPEYFHRSQALILCPSSLIENWYEEFLMWTPRNNCLGPLRKIKTSNTFQERLRELSAWDQDGGVLIMSYDVFRIWIHNKEIKNRGRPLQDNIHQQVRRQLLDGPRIVVADEAHKMKNRAAGIATAASEFRSNSRIALTGSPLANNLIDYFAMVDWIAPRYLGEFVEFKANYVEPIEEGLYVDSSNPERRKSLKKLQVLKGVLSPKVNRADIAVLKGSLPPKVEFVITVPLTELQEKAYNSYVTSILEGKWKGEIGNAMLWSWLAILSLCCNHPACFHDKLFDQTKSRKSYRRSDDVDYEEIPGDGPISLAGFSDEMIAHQKEIFAGVSDLLSPELSYRARILDGIISESVKAGDKVLIFSHSIPTLDYVENILKISRRRYSRLDGSTPIANRQIATKTFNLVGSEQQVYLISTRAGGLGLNIPGANRVIIFDFSFSPTWEEQAVGRSYRLGQRKPVFVYRFIAGGTFEEVMYNKAVFKTQLAFRVVDKKNPIRLASKSLKEYLFPTKPVQEEDISKYVGKDPLVLDKIIRSDQQKIIRRIALTETFQREDNDKLTEEEKRDVQEQLDDEMLKRRDPEAYGRKLKERLDAIPVKLTPSTSIYHYTSPPSPSSVGLPPVDHRPNRPSLLISTVAGGPTAMLPPIPVSNSPKIQSQAPIVFESAELPNRTQHAATPEAMPSRHNNTPSITDTSGKYSLLEEPGQRQN